MIITGFEMPQTLIRVRPDTRRVVDAIVAAKDWSLAKTAEKAFELLRQQEGVPLPESRTAKQSRQKRDRT